IREFHVTGVQTCALPICTRPEAVIAYSAQAIGSIGEDTGVSLSEDDGLILFTIQASVIGGQSVQLPYGEPFVQVSPDESSDEARSEERRVGKAGGSVGWL